MSAPAVILAVDHGTSGVKTSLVTSMGEVLATESEATALIFTEDGGVEQDPAAWWHALLRTGRRLVERGLVPADAVRAVSVSSTFSTTVAVGHDGRPLMNAITWMDGRGAPDVARAFGGFPSLRGYHLPTAVRWLRRTGGVPTLTGKDDLAHALFVQRAFPDLYARTHKFLPSKDYLNLCLTGLTAASFDSIALFWLADIRRPADVRYDAGLVRAVGLDPDKLPELRRSTDVLGPLLPEVAAALGLPAGDPIPVVVGSPDHQCAGVGSGAVRDFEPSLYVGTSSWLYCGVPFKKTDVLHSIASLPTCIPGKYYAANEQDLAGGCLAFLLEKLLCPGNALCPSPGEDGYRHLDAAAAAAPPGSRGVLFTPWLNGERTPVDDPGVRGGFFNLSQRTSQEHLVRAVMEGVALNTRWSLRHVERFVGRPFEHLRIVGGAALSDTWCQIFSDVLQRPLWRVQAPRAANARGAAMIAAVALGWTAFEQAGANIPIERVFEPATANGPLYDSLFREFLRLYRATRGVNRRLSLDLALTTGEVRPLDRNSVADSGANARGARPWARARSHQRARGRHEQ